MSSPPPSPSPSIPVKKRSNLSHDESASSSTRPYKAHYDESAAAALASLAEKPNSDSPKRTEDLLTPLQSVLAPSDGHLSESEASYSSQNSVLPKAVHAPLQNTTMVDHTYTDYSVIAQESLSFLEEGEEPQPTISDEEKKVHNKKVEKIKRIFGDVGPSKKNSGGVVKPFPEKLMEVLDRADLEGIITWMPHGRAFIVLQPQQLREVVLPRFFKQTKFMSFTRQLNLWGFKRITKGVDSGAYYHELFLRSRPRLAMLMRRQKIKGTGIKLTPNPETEPDFYAISLKRPLPAVDRSKNEVKPLPPLRHTTPKGGDAHSNALEYDRIRRLNNMRHPQQHFDRQIYPFSTANQALQSNTLGMSQGMTAQHGSMTNLNQHGSMTNNLNQHVGMTMPKMQENVAMRQLIQQQQQQQTQPSNAELLSILRQRAFLEQQQQQKAVASAQQLLSQIGGVAPVNDNIQIHELKQLLLNAANSLDHLNQPQEIMQQQNLMAPNGFNHNQPQENMQQRNIMSPIRFNHLNQPQEMMQQPNLMAPNGFNHLNQQPQEMMQQKNLMAPNGFNPLTSPQQQQPNNNNSTSSMAVLMNALENTRNVAFATQARLQQVTRDLANAQNRQSL